MRNQKIVFFAIVGCAILIALIGVAAEAGYLSQLSKIINENRNEEDSALGGVNLDAQTETDLDDTKDDFEIEVPMGEDGFSDESVRTPYPIVDAVVADGGRYWVLKFLGLSGLGIYDAQTEKIEKIISLQSEEFLYAAGGKMILVYYPESNMFQTWSLETFEEVMTGNNPNGIIVTQLTMGHNDDDRALIMYSHSKESYNQKELYFLDIDTLHPIREDISMDSGLKQRWRNYLIQRANGNLTIISEWTFPPTETRAAYQSNDGWHSTFLDGPSGYLAVGDDGLIYTDYGKIFTPRLEEVVHLPQYHLIPGIGGSFFLGIAHDGELEVFSSGSIMRLGSVGMFPSQPDTERSIYYYRVDFADNSPYYLDRSVVFNPQGGYILFIPPENDRVIKRTFNPQQMLNNIGGSYLVVNSMPNPNAIIGETWQYQIDIITNGRNVTYSIEFGPEGMAIDDNGKMVWDVPSETVKRVENVIVLIKDDDGNETYHSFELKYVPPP